MEESQSKVYTLRKARLSALVFRVLQQPVGLGAKTKRDQALHAPPENQSFLHGGLCNSLVDFSLDLLLRPTSGKTKLKANDWVRGARTQA